MAMFEDTIRDAGTGLIANATFGDYLVAVNADVPDVEVSFVGEPVQPDGHQGRRRDRPLSACPRPSPTAAFHATGRRVSTISSSRM